ncbi:MAG: pyridine nucleotide-disulfide oxidoreductase [Robiginitomaculum sp.]|nr:MAG: pyridine nucleotide-disulfide oxidoreductase [Robiginitomaculum sp.]
MKKGTIIVGAGQAGAQAATSLRQFGYDLPIVMIGDEPDAPYQRPPLSKTYLAGSTNAAELGLKPEAFWSTQNIELRLGQSVEQIDPTGKKVRLSDDGWLAFSDLILATGARPRLLPVPGAELDNIFVLRTLADADALKAAFGQDKKLVIIGGGYVGLECAATAIKAGMSVTLLEAEPRLLARVAGEQLSDFFADVHRKAGVDIRLDERAIAFGGEGAVRSVTLQSGEELDADLVLVGIGVIANEELAAECGLACDNGIVVDDLCRTSNPNIYAIGDVSRHPNQIFAQNLRLESVHNAIEQGKTAASNIAGRPKPYNQAPWFWSDQYDLKLQMVGLSSGYDQVVIRGDISKRAFAVFYLKNDVMIACDAVNSPAEYMGSRLMIGGQMTVDPALLKNTDLPMKELLARFR